MQKMANKRLFSAIGPTQKWHRDTVKTLMSNAQRASAPFLAHLQPIFYRPKALESDWRGSTKTPVFIPSDSRVVTHKFHTRTHEKNPPTVPQISHFIFFYNEKMYSRPKSLWVGERGQRKVTKNYPRGMSPLFLVIALTFFSDRLVGERRNWYSV